MAELFKNAKTKVLLLGTATAATIGGTAVAFADDPKVSTIIGRILGIVCSIFRYIGILLLAWSIGMLILAFKNEDADSKSRSIMLIVVSVALIALKTLLTDIFGDDLGLTISDDQID